MSQDTWKIFSKSKDDGFTLLEVLVVVFMVGILAAISSPGWLGFLKRQRLNKANDIVLAALQEAQREAKKNKRNYSVSFQTNSGIPQMSVYFGSTPKWRNLTQELGIKSGEVIVGTNLDTTANTVTSPATVVFNNLSTAKTVTFDYMGALAGTSPSTGIKIVVANPRPANSTNPSNSKRCVIIETLIGGMRTAKDSDCN
ncbi:MULTISPECIES: pilus assembly FimT family protein [Calothrix]|uniref:Type II secretion system protein n=2 Tax=Calothrix TaxID=1186 RepID=A0ABR8AA04_9CYAN|nr:MULTISPECIES: type II secretion system protein [Calothrix]MBD2196489.1 type II secretion system protein [Calothrix parietina FACHB-288]MBD2224616.1 type II secretion system protein [Calothrix anomala FACHB-343]